MNNNSPINNKNFKNVQEPRTPSPGPHTRSAHHRVENEETDIGRKVHL